MQPSPDELGIQSSQIVQMLKETKKNFAQVHIVVSVPQLQLSGRYQEVQFQGDTTAFCLEQCKQWSVYNLGICYKHTDGGHCILFQQTSDTPARGGFKDLQSGQSDLLTPDNIYAVFTPRPLESQSKSNTSRSRKATAFRRQTPRFRPAQIM